MGGRLIVAGALALATVVTLAFALDLGRPDFWDPGESRYAETVREMLASGNWLQPTLGNVRYYDKPPGYFWVVAVAFRAFGPHEWAARLPSVAAAVLTIALVVGFGWRRVGPRASLLAGAVLATAVQFVALGRSVRMDMLLTFLMTATLVPVFVLWERRSASPGATVTWPLYAFPAAGLLVKGPVTLLLPVLIVVAHLVVTRTSLSLRRLRPSPGALVVLALVALWYVVSAIRAPDYLWTFVWQHNVGRFVGRALAGHQEPPWFYLWVLPVTFLPWTIFLPGALARAVRKARRGDRLAIFLLAWCAVPFVFFSLSRAKLATYLLPIFPALALLVAAYVDRALRAPVAVRTRVFRIPLLVWSATMILVAVGTPLGVAIAYPGYGVRTMPMLLLATFAAFGWWILRTARWRAVPAAVVTATLATTVLFYRVGAPVVNDFGSLRAAAEIAHALPVETTVFAYKTRGHSFTYYGGRPLSRVRSPAAAAEVLGRAEPTAVLVKTRHLEQIRSHLRVPVCIWWQGPAGRALLANIPLPTSPEGPRLAPAATTSPPADGAPRC